MTTPHSPSPRTASFPGLPAHSFIGLLLLGALLSMLLAAAQTACAQGNIPMRTDWGLYRIGPEARAESGMDATLLAVLFMTPDEDWYTYSNVPSELGRPTQLTVRTEKGSRELTTLYPEGERKRDAFSPDVLVDVYHDRTPLFVPLPEDLTSNDDAPPIVLVGSLRLLLCTSGKCLPVMLPVRFEIASPHDLPEASAQSWWPDLLHAASPKAPRGDSAASAPEERLEKAAAMAADGDTATVAAWELTPDYFLPGLEVRDLLPAMLLGLLAGFLLNFMPCVLPVISIKLTSLLGTANGGREADTSAGYGPFREHNIFFALGILLYFLFLSALLTGTGLAWGEMFQKPGLVLALGAVMFALCLSLFGVYSLPVIDLKFDQRTSRPKLQALLTGLIVTLLATPCSGPLLGGVLGWAIAQPEIVAGTVFVSIGVGMALPYLAMAAFPALSRAFPRPGAWTIYVERIAAVFLLGTCIYLVNILPNDLLLPGLGALFATGMLGWVLGALDRSPRKMIKAVVTSLVLLALVGGTVLLLQHPTASEASPWQEFDAATFRQQVADGPVLIDFTADWCPSCKLLESTTLSDDNVRELAERYGLTPIRADMTDDAPAIEALLHALGSRSIPVAAIFSPDRPKRPLVLRDLFTSSQLRTAIERTLTASSNGTAATNAP